MVAIGVDTHKASLAACAIDEVGRPISERTFANNPKGHREFVRWAGGLPQPRRIGLEGSANFGFGLARLLAGAGEDTREVRATLTHRERRRTGRPGKCDRADALAIARVVAREERLPAATGTAMHRDLRLLVDYRDQLLSEQTRIRNRLHADLQALLPGYRESLGRLSSASHMKAARRMLSPLAEVATEIALLRLARLEAITAEANQLKRRIEAAISASHEALTAIPGVGPLMAARLLGETGDPRRFRSSAAFAMTCGAAPIPASSGETCRYRLNRGGNRRLNRALHIVALTQVRCHPPARAFVERKRAEGKTWWEAMRCLKRHLANAVFHAMLTDQAATSLTT
jgi:transposase